MKLNSADISFDLLGAARADDRAGYGRILKRPGNRDLSRRTSMTLTDFS
jgi:hypothetical protein